MAGFVGSGMLSVLVIAASLTPSAEGHGTHTELGLPPCSFAVAFGKPCATCGMTTCFAHAAEGHFGTAFLTQPFGLVLALIAASGVWVCAHTAVTGSLAARVGLRLMSKPMVLWMLGGAWLVSWFYKLATWSSV